MGHFLPQLTRPANDPDFGEELSPWTVCDRPQMVFEIVAAAGPLDLYMVTESLVNLTMRLRLVQLYMMSARTQTTALIAVKYAVGESREANDLRFASGSPKSPWRHEPGRLRLLR